jgi:hypothetical protein
VFRWLVARLTGHVFRVERARAPISKTETSPAPPPPNDRAAAGPDSSSPYGLASAGTRRAPPTRGSVFDRREGVNFQAALTTEPKVGSSNLSGRADKSLLRARCASGME